MICEHCQGEGRMLRAARGGNDPDSVDMGECPECQGTGKVDDYQTIETAPKDGTHILAYRKSVGIRTTNLTNPPTVVHWFDDPNQPGFYTSVNELAPERPFNPTHWMPLPAAPK